MLFIFPGTPSITNLEYNSPTQTLTCTSTGGVVQVVTWKKNGMEIGPEFIEKQFITNFLSATYQHTLSSNDSVNLIGQFTCQIETRGRVIVERTQEIFGMLQPQ